MSKNNTGKCCNSLMASFMRYVNGDDTKLESNIVDVNKSHEDYINKHAGEAKRKFKFFDYTMNTYLILFTLTTLIALVLNYFFYYR